MTINLQLVEQIQIFVLSSRSNPDIPPPTDTLTSTPSIPSVTPTQQIIEPPVVQPPPQSNPTHITRSGRSVRPPPRFDETSHSSIHAYSTTYSPAFNTTSACILQPSQEFYSEPQNSSQDKTFDHQTLYLLAIIYNLFVLVSPTRIRTGDTRFKV